MIGRLCDGEWVKARYVCQAAEIVGGIATILLTLSHKYAVLVAYNIFFGLCEGAYLSTQDFVVLTCVPAQQRASAIGWKWLSVSFSVASGPTLAGKASPTLFPGPSPLSKSLAGRKTLLPCQNAPIIVECFVT